MRDVATSPRQIHEVACLAVLPFENLSTTPGAGEAMADLVALGMVRNESFYVRERTDTLRVMQGMGVSAAEVDASSARAAGGALGVQAVLTGTVTEYELRPPRFSRRGAFPTFSVTLRLVGVEAGDLLWIATYNGTPGSIVSASGRPLLSAAEDVAEYFVAALRSKVGSRRLPGRPCWELGGTPAIPTVEPTPPPPLVVGLPPATPPPVPTPLLPTVAAPLVPGAALKPAQRALLAKMQANERFSLDGVVFQGQSTSVPATAKKALADLAAVLDAHPEVKLRVEAHLDPTDPNPVPTSQKQADAIVAELKSLGVSKDAVEAKGMGGSKSIFPSFVEAMKAKNRRVEFLVLTAAKADVAAAPARVKVLAAQGTEVQAVRLANALKQGGTNVTKIAAIAETRKATNLFFTSAFAEEARRLAQSIAVPGGASLQETNGLGSDVDIVIVVGSDVEGTN